MERISPMADKYRVAIASTDGETVNIHYGKSELFYVYIVDDDEGYDLLESRSVTPVCQEGFHDKAAMDTHVQQFKDCKYVVQDSPRKNANADLCHSLVVGKTILKMPLEWRQQSRKPAKTNTCVKSILTTNGKVHSRHMHVD